MTVDMKENQQEQLLQPEFLQKLQSLEMAFRKMVKGSIKGERKSTRRGRSVEFADYRDYTPGDEIRIIDWNVFGRLDRLFVKLFVEEEEVTLYLLIDSSASMDFGQPNKLMYARKIAAALSFISLSGYDRVSLALMSDRLTGHRGPIRGRNQIFQVFKYLQEIQAHGGTSIGESLLNFSARRKKPGIVVIISDFLDPGDFTLALGRLQFQKHQLYLIQILDESELNPQTGGDVKLRDMETGQEKEVTITDDLLNRYRKAVEDHCDKIRSFCRRNGAGYILAPSRIPFEELVLEYLRAGRLLR